MGLDLSIVFFFWSVYFPKGVWASSLVSYLTSVAFCDDSMYMATDVVSGWSNHICGHS